MTLTHALLPQLIQRRGFIINVSSLAGESPLPFLASYGAAKAGVTSWSLALRAELAACGVAVVTLCPGPSPTGFRKVSGMRSGPGSIFRTPAAVVVAAALRKLSKGGGLCLPGIRHRLLFWLQRLTPRELAARAMANYLGQG